MIELDALNRIINDAKKHGNSFFGLLGRAVHASTAVGCAGSPPGLLLPDFHQRSAHHPKIARERPVGQQHGPHKHRGLKLSAISAAGASVLNKTLAGLQNCIREKLIVGVATQCLPDQLRPGQRGLAAETDRHGRDLRVVSHLSRVGPDPSPHLALTPEQVLNIRTRRVHARTMPIGLVDATGMTRPGSCARWRPVSAITLGLSGSIEPCPIIQFAKESIHDDQPIYDQLTKSAFLADFRKTAAAATRGCVVLERPDLVRDLVKKHSAPDTTRNARRHWPSWKP